MINQGRKRPVSVEDLLRFKRAERPPAGFWQQFERELRAKQLAALVEKRPWWREISFAQALAGLRRYHVPTSAAAVLAFSVVSWRSYQPAASSPSIALREDSVAVAAPAPVASVSFETARSKSAALAVATVDESGHSAGAPPPESGSTSVQSLARITPVMGAASVPDEPAVTLPSAGLITDSFASTPPSGGISFPPQLLPPTLELEARAVPARTKPVEPLAQIKLPTSRRSSLLSSAIPVSASGPVLNSERSARSLSDERLYDTVTRVSTRGTSVAVKF